MPYRWGMETHSQYPRTWAATKRVIITCPRCGTQEWAYVRGSARPKLCSAHSAPIKSINGRRIAA